MTWVEEDDYASECMDFAKVTSQTMQQVEGGDGGSYVWVLCGGVGVQGMRTRVRSDMNFCLNGFSHLNMRVISE